MHVLAALFYGFTAAFLWVDVFEILWQSSFLAFGSQFNPVGEVILGSWLALGGVSWKYWFWRENKYFWYQLLLFASLWSLWIMLGYPQIPTSEGFLFNIPLKILAFTTILALFKPRRSYQSSYRPVDIPQESLPPRE